MFSRAALTVFVLTVAELTVLGVAVRAWGVALVATAVVASAVIGVVLLRKQLSGIFSNGVAGLRIPAGDADIRWITDRGLYMAAGVLMVLPGLLTSAVGGLLIAPPVRVAVAGIIRRRLPSSVGVANPFVPANGRSPRRRDVVDVDVVAEDMPTSARSELN